MCVCGEASEGRGIITNMFVFVFASWIRAAALLHDAWIARLMYILVIPFFCAVMGARVAIGHVQKVGGTKVQFKRRRYSSVSPK